MRRIPGGRIVIIESQSSRSETGNTDRESFQKVIDASENDFEKSLTFISAGALGLSMGFIEKIVSLDSATCKSILIAGWILLTVTLGLNLISHMISKKMSQKSQDDHDNNHENLHLRIRSRNATIDRINWLTVALLVIGISLIVIFVSINTFNMAKKSSEQENQKADTIKQDSLKKEKFGRTIPLPPPTQDSTKKPKK